MTAKLILSLNGVILDEYPLDKERVTIGRKPTNDIAIDNLAVSGEHAVVITLLNDSFLEDLDSTNGVVVNGFEVKKHYLIHNDLIEVGRHTLLYVNDQQKPLADVDKTVLVRHTPKNNVVDADKKAPRERSAPSSLPHADKDSTEANSHLSTQTQHTAAHPVATIQILTGPNTGKELELTKSLTTLGKPGVQVAVLTRRPHGFYITHVEGKKFPSINGLPIKDQPHVLQDHDVIELAGIKMEFYLK
ncbi:MAG: FHA domain-containing protein [Gallionella sp.]|nr:FHA domain-containing protein [Gallionella sp.]